VPLSKIGFDLENGVTKMDDRTVRFKLEKPFSVFREFLYLNMIIPVGYDPASPVGTGAFKFKTFDPGQQSTMDANENYWADGPYVDELIMLDIRTTRRASTRCSRDRSTRSPPFRSGRSRCSRARTASAC